MGKVLSTPQKPGQICVVNGEIGAGKTTLIRSLTEYLTELGYCVCPVYEPVHLWGDILKKFYGDPPRYAYELQTFVHVTRVQAIRDAFKYNPDADLYLLERSPVTDRYIFMEMLQSLIGAESMARYELYYDMHHELLPIDLSAAKNLYLKPSLGCCMKRVQKRARDGEIAETKDGARDGEIIETKGDARDDDVIKTKSESAKGGVTLEYQTQLREAHEALLEGKHPNKFTYTRPFSLETVNILEDDGDFDKPGTARDAILKKVCDWLGLFEDIVSEPIEFPHI